MLSFSKANNNFQDLTRHPRPVYPGGEFITSLKRAMFRETFNSFRISTKLQMSGTRRLVEDSPKRRDLIRGKEWKKIVVSAHGITEIR